MTEKQMFDLLVTEGLSEHGAAALLGHFQAESGLNPRNLQNIYEKKLGFTDDTYTVAVDSGSYADFVRDCAGYGLAQWTYWSRKQELLEFARNSGCSVGDAGMQLKFALYELKGNYKDVFNALKTAVDIRAASDIVLTQYERPADQSEAVKQKRAGYGQEIYKRCSGKMGEAGGEITEAQARQKLVSVAIQWYGRKESDGSHREIIDIYNGHAPLARGYKVKYTDAWCATFGSAAAIAAGYTDIIPTECGCGQMIELFRKMGRWVEDDAYIPSPGDYIFYDWDDSGAGDCAGWPEHVGIVVSVSEDKIRVIEGNKNDAVEYREIDVNGRYIRGYGIPDYASKATAPEAPEPAETGWEKDAQGRYRYKEDNGAYASNKWLLINHHWYLFGKDGYMLTGWQRWNGSNIVGADDPGEWYFLDNTPGGPLEGACWHSTDYGALRIWDVQE